jgi:hypothetical protein
MGEMWDARDGVGEMWDARDGVGEMWDAREAWGDVGWTGRKGEMCAGRAAWMWDRKPPITTDSYPTS